MIYIYYFFLFGKTLNILIFLLKSSVMSKSTNIYYSYARSNLDLRSVK